MKQIKKNLEETATEYLVKAGLFNNQIQELKDMGYFSAPASKAHHLAETGGHGAAPIV